MTRKQRRGLLIGGGVAVLAVSLILVLFAMRGAIVYFYTPSDVITKSVEPGQRFCLGGLVAGGSVDRGEGTKVGFSVTDTLQTIQVRYDGVLPDLFREGQGVIAEGKLDGNNRLSTKGRDEISKISRFGTCFRKNR